MNSDRRKGTAEEPGHERGGGWKLPLLCAAAAAAAAVLFWGLKAATTSDPAIDSELMEISTSWMQEATENSSRPRSEGTPQPRPATPASRP